MTRALGDSYMKELVTGHPYTTETVLQDDDDFILLACDGVSICPFFFLQFFTNRWLLDSYGMFVRIRKRLTLSKMSMIPKKPVKFSLTMHCRDFRPIISVA